MTTILSLGGKYPGIGADLIMHLTYPVILISLPTAKSMDTLNVLAVM
ncbi:hypothetical protein [Yersinia frederiksenii]|nr:hypothetical protein [Yersinia frederiksenii]EEQ12920.1 hypothetical protein yfred0001_13410 [Yersinia frederiksenii ATCC 33641]